MIGVDKHCRIVGESLVGARRVDEQTYASVSVLSERLERLKQSNSLFAGVTLSAYAENLSRPAEAVAAS